MELESDDIIKVIKAYERYQMCLKDMRVVTVKITAQEASFYCPSDDVFNRKYNDLLQYCIGEDEVRRLSEYEKSIIKIYVSNPFRQMMFHNSYSEFDLHFVKTGQYGKWYAGTDLEEVTERAKDNILRNCVD